MFQIAMLLFAGLSLLFTYLNIETGVHFIGRVVFPTCAAIMTFSATMYSVKHKSNARLRLLMYFMMLSSLTYMTAFLANEFVQCLHGVTLLLSFHVLRHFLQVDDKRTRLLLLCYPVLLVICAVVQPLYLESVLAIGAIASLVGVFLAMGRFVKQGGQVVVISLAIMFIPYVFLYLPFQGAAWLPLELATLSLLLISLLFVFTPLIEQLLGKQIQVKKVRYYGYISMVTAAIIVGCMTPVLADSRLAVLYFLFISVLLHMMLYAKEQLDFQTRRFMVTSDQEMTQYLLQVIHRLSLCTSKKQLYALLIEELYPRYRAFLAEEPNALEPLRLTKAAGQYRMPLGKQQVVVFPHRRLSNDDIVWLELLFVYVDNFARSLDQIEVLVQRLQEQSSPWLNTLVFQLLEKEKRGIAQELHDTVLQELLHVARGVEDLQPEQLRELLHEAAFELREYCEGLHPPLIETHGLKGAIDKLVQKTKLRANFLLEVYVEPVEIANPLFVYRIIQELLNNAMKHAQATKVSLSLYEEQAVIMLRYVDDGIGLADDIQASMGLNGIQERVKAMNGVLTIERKPYTLMIEIPNGKELVQ